METVELYVNRRDFEALRQGSPGLAVLNSEAETLGTLASGAQVTVREFVEGFATRRWMVLSLESIGPPTDDGTAITFAQPPVVYHHGGPA